MKRFFSFVLTTCILVSASFAQVRPGDVAPDFSVTLPGGDSVTLSDYKGKALLLHFWATWCPPCQKELPEMEKLNKKIASSGAYNNLAFLAVCISDTEVAFTKYMKRNRFSFTSALDQNAVSAKLYSVFAIPTSILISPDGRIEKVHTGAMTWQALQAFVEDYEE